MILSEVKSYRIDQPFVGTRKLQHMLQTTGISIGRDRLFSLLKSNNLLINKKKQGARTTNSYHRFYCYKNLIKDLHISFPNQVWVSDITYIRTLKGYQYLSLITDYYSRKIIGYNLSDSLSIEGSLTALKMALKFTRNPEGIIHHSDRGIQYCSHAYTNLLKENNMLISMTEKDHVYENSLAERVNGILKQEFCLGETLISKDVTKILVKESIETYNGKRLHMSLNYKTPNYVYSN